MRLQTSLDQKVMKKANIGKERERDKRPNRIKEKGSKAIIRRILSN